MIYGVGTDIVSIERIEHILNKNMQGLVNRILTDHEKALFANKGNSPAYCAKRFAAKEAFAKALGTGKSFFGCKPFGTKSWTISLVSKKSFS